MLPRTLLPLLFAILPVLSQENAEFLIENAKLCGNPFSDPIWIPVLDTCTVKCDPASEYCVENEELVQQCKPLPDDCKKLLRLRLRSQQRQKNLARSLGAQNRDTSPIQFDDRLVEHSHTRRAKFTVVGNSKLRSEPAVAGETRKSRDSHRVKRL